MNGELMRMEHIIKTYGSVRALEDMSMTVGDQRLSASWATTEPESPRLPRSCQD